MDSSIAFTSIAASALAALLALDLVASAIRNRSAIRRGLDRPLRVIVGSTMCATLVLGAVRPVLAATPPPAMRVVAGAEAPGAGVEHGTPAVPEERHTVAPGESLWRIARTTLLARGLPATGTDVAAFWPHIYEINRDVIGTNPHLIHPGQVLQLPPVGSTTEAAHGA